MPYADKKAMTGFHGRMSSRKNEKTWTYLSRKKGRILLANPKMEQIPCWTRSLEVEGARNMPMHKR